MPLTLIKQAEIIDGSGGPPFKGDVLLEGEAIAQVGPELGALVGNAAGLELVEAAGLALTPGFIDTHSHSDLSLLDCPGADSSVCQGVTTEVVGNCGLSVFPVAPASREQLRSYLKLLSEDLSRLEKWNDLTGYASAMEAAGLGLNLAPLIGHGSLRIAVMGFDSRPATAAEMAAMKDLLAQALDQGAVGLSSGLVYPPGIIAPPEELIELAKVVAAKGGLYTSHLRGDTLRKGPSLVESLAEALDLGRRTGVRLHVSHAAPKFPNLGVAREMINLMEAHRAAGLEVTCDAHPFMAAMTFLASLLPPWVFEGGWRTANRRLTGATDRAKVLKAVEETFSHLDPAEFWSRCQIIMPDQSHPFNGLRMDEIAARAAKPAPEMLIELLAEVGEQLFSVGVVMWIYTQAETRRMFEWPGTMVGADGLASSPEGDLGGLALHPRSWATFTKFLIDYCRDDPVLDPAQAVHRMTGLPAQTFNLTGRGLIKPDYKADLVLLDLKELAVRSSFESPKNCSDGVRQVWINGRPTVTGNRRNQILPGRMVRLK